MHEVLYESGYAISNCEQERILNLYQDPKYIQKRDEIKSDSLFWTQPQERVVEGLPLFCLINDALQIHRAYRGEKDRVVITAVHIPHELLESGKVKLTANTAIDLDYENSKKNFVVRDFWRLDGHYEVDFESLRSRGIDLHEMYTKDLPMHVDEAEKLGISQDVFLLGIYRVGDSEKIMELFNDTETLKKNKHFLHGFFGDQNVFGRGNTKYLPYECQQVFRK